MLMRKVMTRDHARGKATVYVHDDMVSAICDATFMLGLGWEVFDVRPDGIFLERKHPHLGYAPGEHDVIFIRTWREEDALS